MESQALWCAFCFSVLRTWNLRSPQARRLVHSALDGSDYVWRSSACLELPDTKLLPVSKATDPHKLALKIAHEVQDDTEEVQAALRAVRAPRTRRT